MTSSSRKDRRHPTEGDVGGRTDFERDRDAILYTTAFRRLAGVTQVVSPTEGHVYHNRLTHTLEVAQIAKGLAEHLIRNQRDLADHYSIEPSTAEAAALAHDLGHPPFGHVAEKELNSLLVKQGVLDGFEGNAQSFRIITKLTARWESHPGLNLARATLNAVLKYPWPQKPDAQGNQTHKKWGVYESEREDFVFARADHASNEHQCVEAQLMDWADDVAYSIHDTEDFFRAGMIPLDTFALKENRARGRFLDAVAERWSLKKIDPGHPWEDLKHAFNTFCDMLPFQQAFEPTREQRVMLRNFTSRYIGNCIHTTKLRDQPTDDGSLLEFDPNVKMQVIMLKELIWQFVILRPSLAAVQMGQRQALRDLFDVFAEAVQGDNRQQWCVLPVRSISEMEHLRSQFGIDIPNTERLRVAADAISGMTDQQTVLMYHRLKGISVGSVLDSIVL